MGFLLHDEFTPVGSPLTESVIDCVAPFMVAIVEIEDPRFTLPELELNESDTRARKLAVTVPGPFTVADVLFEEVKEREIEEELFVQFSKT
jgi:hypothetical protein